MKYNQGLFEGNTYRKRVSFSSAVLWKCRQISLNPSVWREIEERGMEYVVFEDEEKNERWRAGASELKQVAELKTEFQEEQYYFPIEVFEVSEIREEKKEIEVVASKVNQGNLL